MLHFIIFVAQGSPYQWSAVGWVRREGDELVVYNCGVFEDLGGEKVTLSSLEAGPTAKTKLFPLTKREQWHRLHVLRIIHSDGKKWEKLCPRPTTEGTEPVL